jgi:hypothetical protein
MDDDKKDYNHTDLSDVTWTASSHQLHPDDESIREHIETLWGVDE